MQENNELEAAIKNEIEKMIQQSDSKISIFRKENPSRFLEIREYIQNSVIGCGCQFIITTHSPFLLAMKRAEIYDLDSNPVVKKKWTDLNNVRVYRDFFKEHEEEFN